MKWDYGLITAKTPQEALERLRQVGAVGWEAVSLAVLEQPEPDRIEVLVKKQSN